MFLYPGLPIHAINIVPQPSVLANVVSCYRAIRHDLAGYQALMVEDHFLRYDYRPDHWTKLGVRI